MLKNIAIILLLGFTAFSMIKYVGELKEKHLLQASLIQAQDQISALAQEKQNLLQEKQILLQEIEKEKVFQERLVRKNKNLKDYLKASKNRIARLFQSNIKVQDDLEDINIRLSILKAENRALIDSRRRLYLENEQLNLKLSSEDELKKIIQELKTKKYEDFELITEGNQGFLIKGGRSTAINKVKIEVFPAQTKK